MHSRHRPVTLALVLLLVGALIFGLPARTLANGVGSLYVSDESSGNIYVVDSVTNTVVAVIAVDGRPHGMVFSADASTVYVADTDANALAVVDTHSEAVAHSVPDVEAPAHLAASPNRRNVVLTGAGGQLTMVDLITQEVAQSLDLGGTPHGLAMSTNGHYVYVANQQSNSVQVVDTVTWKLSGTYPAPGGPTHIVLSPGQDKAYVLTAAGTLLVISLATSSVERTLPVASNPSGLAISPNGRTVYVTHADQPVLSLIDTATSTVHTVNLPAPSTSIALTVDGGLAYVALPSSKALALVDTAAGQVLDTIPIPGRPSQLAMSPIQAPTLPQAGPPLTVPAKLPKTGAVPLAIVGAFGLLLLGAGRLIRSR